jgi:hypothetical protein
LRLWAFVPSDTSTCRQEISLQVLWGAGRRPVKQRESDEFEEDDYEDGDFGYDDDEDDDFDYPPRRASRPQRSGSTKRSKRCRKGLPVPVIVATACEGTLILLIW